MRFTHDEFLKIVTQFPNGVMQGYEYERTNLHLFWRYSYCGKPALFVKGGVVLLDKCAYCGSDDYKTYKNLMDQECCSHCNAPILWENY